MEPSTSAAAMQRFFRDRGIDLASATLPWIVEAALDFYEAVPASGLSEDSEADMLLFQFGVYNWGSGENFDFDITRQFVLGGELEGDDAISQLPCTTYYEPSATLRAVGKSDRWCKSRADLPAFSAFILSSDAYRTALTERARRTEINWSPV